MSKAKKTAEEPIKTGRPRAEIDWSQVDALCAIHCTSDEIATVVGVHLDTLRRHCKKEFNCSFATYIRQKRGAGKASLRRRMWKSSERSVAMQIYLSKNWLGMSDNPEPEEDDRPSSRLSLKIDHLDDLDSMIDDSLDGNQD